MKARFAKRRKKMEEVKEIPTEVKATPKRVALVACGPSVGEYVYQSDSEGSPKVLWDEVWAINSSAPMFRCDMVWHMDDFRLQEIRAPRNPKVRNMIEWMKQSPVPIMTSTAYPEYPMSREYPLEDVISHCGAAYFNTSPAYALAYALMIGVEDLWLYGMDYTRPDMHSAESGRGCCEFWISRLMAAGCLVRIPKGCTMLDQHQPLKFYGYDSRKPVITASEDRSRAVITFEPIPLPTAEEIERRYNHNLPLEERTL